MTALEIGGSGFGAIWRPYQAFLIKKFLEMRRTGVAARNRKLTSRDAHNLLNKHAVANPELKVSRASVINFLNSLVDENYIDYYEATGKGGYHRVYIPKLNASEFESLIRTRVQDTLDKVFPQGWDIQ